jgi:hypothetical protein
MIERASGKLRKRMDQHPNADMPQPKSFWDADKRRLTLTLVFCLRSSAKICASKFWQMFSARSVTLRFKNFLPAKQKFHF